MHFEDEVPVFEDKDLVSIERLKTAFHKSFKKISSNDVRTLEFYYKLGETRGVDGFVYVNEAIQRASMKQNLNKPISYIASLCKSFYKNGLYAQPFTEENDIVKYLESRVGKINLDNKRLIQSAISTNGAVRVMAATSEVLNNSPFQDRIVEEIILAVVKIFGRPGESNS